ncbi:pyridoxal phosphate-dependent decarboxylase family protein [Streptomyces sp. NBC_01237]|uniref:pyridoxal phosphate-dependent decarboxylase family protein n=1 Tax=Streptomyces sp. NBC_01237 TaxID=2903790 RepID=UPI002DDC7B9D|nr:aspartate aminotransferase family protein [Streptomyces sp. NBC_01237]WRZ72568.1 aspartate aminotransferase family protein [Streptomyces sp. NBC_01237]
MRSHLLNHMTAEHYRRTVTAGVEQVAAGLTAAERPFSGVGVDELSPVVGAIDLDRPLGDVSAALDELSEVYLRDSVHFHHPRYLGHLHCPVVIPAVLGEAVLSAVNSSLDSWDRSAGGTLIERRLIDWTAERIGLGPAADGIFTSGGTQSTLQALLLAREEVASRPEHFARLRILTSECGHIGVRKAARILGLGPDSVISLPVDRDRRMQTVALARALERCAAEGTVPMAVVATAGTADFGSIDPLPEIAALCEQFSVRMHVDAAYGCGLLASRERRGLLEGIERADSVTVDYHKSFFQPVSSSAVLVRDRAALRHVTYHAEYPDPRRMTGERSPDQADKSLQTTRRFDALKLWMTLRVMGADGIGELFDEVCDRAAEGWRLLAADPRFEVVVRPRLSTLVFRFIPSGVTSPAEIDRANLYARKALFASGEAVVAGTKVGARQYLKFTLLNPETTVRDIAAVLDLISGHAEKYLGESLVRAS